MKGAETPLSGAIVQAPRAHDPARAESVLSELPECLRHGALGDLLHGATGSSPYLARLVQRQGDWLAHIMDEPPDGIFDGIIASLTETEFRTLADIRTALRVAKARAALLIALADLGGVWDLGRVTGALTLLADTAVETAARFLLQVRTVSLAVRCTYWETISPCLRPPLMPPGNRAGARC